MSRRATSHAARSAQDDELTDEPARRRRVRSRGPLLVALFCAAVIVQILLPLAYWLFRVQPVGEPPIEVEVAVIDTPSPDEKVAQPTRQPREPNDRQRPSPTPQRVEPPKRDQPRRPPRPEELEAREKARLKMVEVNNPESERPPPNARYLSDKNRIVERETRARQTNLQRDAVPSPPTEPNRAQEAGKRRKRVAEELEQAHRRRRPRPDRPRKKRSPLLSMRQQRARPARDEVKHAPPEDAHGVLRARQPAHSGQTALALNLDHRDYDRIFGEQAAQERRRARSAPSSNKGGGSKRWSRVRSALENFIPEVQPGNQTALGTRADPFALYIARMHRSIHKLWGFGFLEDLSREPATHRLNNTELWTMVEIVVSPSGEVEKATIVKPSGELAFDSVALDTVFSGGPYPPTPNAIRSANGRAYLHWRFHRNHRQCGTFGVDPYILTTPPDGPIDSPMDEVGGRSSGASETSGRPGQARHHHPRISDNASHHPAEAAARPIHAHHHHPRAPGGASRRPSGTTPEAPVEPDQQQPSTDVPSAPKGRSRATRGQRGSPTNAPNAQRTVERFLAAFRAGDAMRMARWCKLPFLARGQTVATERAELARMLADLMKETSRRTAASGPLLTPVAARGKLGRLPRGVDYDANTLLTSVELGEATAILILQREGPHWTISGLNR
jgi:TonB family protein